MEMEKLKKVISEVLGTAAEDIQEEMSFVDDLGADSLEIFQIVMGIEEEFDIEIDESAAAGIVTVADAYAAIRSTWEID